MVLLRNLARLLLLRRRMPVHLKGEFSCRPICTGQLGNDTAERRLRFEKEDQHGYRIR